MSKGSGCIGCLGSVVFLALIGSVFFGGGVLMRVGSMGLSFGKPVDPNQIIADYLNEKAEVADEAVKTFHSQLNQGKCQEIYEKAHEILKSTTRLTDMVTLCTEMKSKLGSVESTKQFDWWQRPSEQGGSYIFARYNTKLSKSTVQETFIWLVNDGNSQLVNYQIVVIQGEGSSLPNSTFPNPLPKSSTH